MQNPTSSPGTHYRVSVKALITNAAGHILVVRENGRDFDLPGGGVEWGESPEEALHRELNEELMITGTIRSNPPIIAPINNTRAQTHVLFLVYRVDVDTDRLQTTPKVPEYRFISLDEFARNNADGPANDWQLTTPYWQELRAALAD